MLNSSQIFLFESNLTRVDSGYLAQKPTHLISEPEKLTRVRMRSRLTRITRLVLEALLGSGRCVILIPQTSLPGRDFARLHFMGQISRDPGRTLTGILSPRIVERFLTKGSPFLGGKPDKTLVHTLYNSQRSETKGSRVKNLRPISNKMEAIKLTCGRSNWSQLVTGGNCLWLMVLLIWTIFIRQNQGQNVFWRMEKEKMMKDNLLTCWLRPQVKNRQGSLGWSSPPPQWNCRTEEKRRWAYRVKMGHIEVQTENPEKLLRPLLRGVRVTSNKFLRDLSLHFESASTESWLESSSIQSSKGMTKGGSLELLKFPSAI